MSIAEREQQILRVKANSFQPELDEAGVIKSEMGTIKEDRISRSQIENEKRVGLG